MRAQRPKWLTSKFAHGPHDDVHEETFRSAFLRDYSSIIHSTYFRRLSGKTQVFSRPNHDHIRNRLTHSIEVSHIARHLCRLLVKQLLSNGVRLYSGFEQEVEDLVAAASLAHDLGHPPFGHIGQNILNDLSFVKEKNPTLKIEFDDNKQVMHLFSREEPYITVTASLAAATVKKLGNACYDEDARQFKEILELCGINGIRHPMSYLMEAADDIAYISGDFEDYLRLGARNEKDANQLINELFVQFKGAKSSLEPEGTLWHLVTDAKTLVSDSRIATQVLRMLLAHTWESLRYCVNDVKSLEELPHAMHEFISRTANKTLFEKKAETNFLYSDCPANNNSSELILKLKEEVFEKRIFMAPYVAQQDVIAKEVLETIWREIIIIDSPDKTKSAIFRLLPVELRGDIAFSLDPENRENTAWGSMASWLTELFGKNTPPKEVRRLMATFISGMTDRFAIDFHAKLKNPEKLRLVS